MKKFAFSLLVIKEMSKNNPWLKRVANKILSDND
jgi:hypothetical protein